LLTRLSWGEDGVVAEAPPGCTPFEARTIRLRDGRELLIREAAVEDATALLDYIAHIAGESDFLSFGPGEFELTRSEEEDFLRRAVESPGRLALVGVLDDELVANLNFSAGTRPRTRHAGGYGMSVRRHAWGLGIGSLMLDALIDWARAAGIVKINLQVRIDNARAIRLYQRKGFAIEGTNRRAIALHGAHFDTRYMGLIL
jgi:RimJ/RimL family protein N-acetyltransferase